MNSRVYPRKSLEPRPGPLPHYDAGVADLADLLNHPAVVLATGTAASAASGVAGAYRACERLPLIGPRLRRGRADLMLRGERIIERSVEPVQEAVAAVAAPLVERVLDEIDLNELVRRRVDLIGLSTEVIDGVDLPAIIRESTGTVTADVMTDVRSQGERADDLVSGFVDRVLRRDRESP